MKRNKAIRLLYAESNKRGWDYDEFHTKVEELGDTHTPYIRLMSPYELARIALILFGRNIRVEDSPLIKDIRTQCRQNDISMRELEEYIDTTWMKNKKISSIYHLDYRQLMVLKTKILEHIITKKINSQTKKAREL